MTPPSLDVLDTSIIEILRTDGRATNQDIAKKLSVTAATVSVRNADPARCGRRTLTAESHGNL